MAKATQIILCQSVLVDQSNPNSLSAIGLISDITVSLRDPLPADEHFNAPIKVHLITTWRRSQEDTGENVVVRYMWGRRKGVQVSAIETEIDLREKRQHRHAVDIRGVAFDKPGLYEIRAQVRKETQDGRSWRTVAALPIDVEFESPKIAE